MMLEWDERKDAMVSVEDIMMSPPMVGVAA